MNTAALGGIVAVEAFFSPVNEDHKRNLPMWLAKLRRSVTGNLSPLSAEHPRGRRRVFPRLDYLEDRTLLSTFTPTLFTDGVSTNAVNTLRDAIIAANNDTGTLPDTINLAAGTYTLSIANTSGHETGAQQGDLNITNTQHTLVIQGVTGTNGKPATIINQTVADRVFQIVNPGTTVIFKNLLIENGNAQDNGAAGVAAGSTAAQGGGLLNNGGNVTMTNVAFSSDHATAGASQSAQGGGIYSLNGTLTLNNVTLSLDTAKGGSNGGNAQGAGLYLSGGKANLTNCLISANNLTGGNGATGGSALGGGIYANAATLTLTGGSVNTALIKGGNGTDGNAGTGGNADGGGVFATQSTVTIQNGTTIHHNTVDGGLGGKGAAGLQGQLGAAGGSGGMVQGGGVYVRGGQLTITGPATSIFSNTATAGIGGQGGAGGLAAVAAAAGAIGGAGGMGGEADGGGVYVLAAPVTVNGGASIKTNSLFGGAGGRGGTGGKGATGNQNGGAGGTGGAGGLAQGGGLFASGSNLAVALGNASTTATLSGDTSSGGAGGNGGAGGAHAGTGFGGPGGGAGTGGTGNGGEATVLGDSLTLTNAIITGGTAIGGNAGRGGTGVTGGAGAAGGLGGTAQGGGLFLSSSSSTTILNSTIYNNEAFAKRGGNGAAGGAGGNGGTGGNGQGGGLYALSSTVSALNSTFADNIVIAGTQGVNAANQPSGSGGVGQGAGIYATTGALTLTNDTIAWNFLKAFTDRGAQPGQGAGVYNVSNDTLKLENTIIALDELFATSTNLNSITTSDLSGIVASGFDLNNFIGDGTGSNLIDMTNGDHVGGPGASAKDPQFLPAQTTVFGLSGQVPGNYGGLTPTLPLNWTSAAINGGDPGAAAAIASAEGIITSSATDQRGFTRVLDSTIDIGATETQLNITNSAPSSATAGQTLAFTLTVSNGETTPIGVTLSDPLPANTTFQSFSAPAGWTFIAPAVGQSGTVTASNTSLAASSTATFTLVVNVSANAQGGTILTNTATLTTSGVSPTFSRSDTAAPRVAGQTTTDITNEIGIKILHAHPDPDSGPNVFEQMVMLVNNSGTTLTGPIALVVTGLPAGVTLLNATGTFNGNPFIDIVPVNGSWQTGHPHFLMPRLEFSDPSGVPITWTAQVIQGI
jgi:uncharacterized repeat protein (TIGR01451 family)